MAGTPQAFRSRAEYDELVAALVATGSIEDGTKIYWDVRPSARFETLEFRVADVCLTVDEAVMMAGLARALARTCHAQAVADEPVTHARPELLRAAKWRAARYGLDADLIDVEAGGRCPRASRSRSCSPSCAPRSKSTANGTKSARSSARPSGAATARPASARPTRAPAAYRKSWTSSSPKRGKALDENGGAKKLLKLSDVCACGMISLKIYSGGLAEGAMKICNICNQPKPLESFSILQKGAQGRHPACKVCRSREAKDRYTRNRDEIIEMRREWRKRTGADRRLAYGLSLEEFNAMVIAQNGRCAVSQ